jgi:hypothetical protein
MIRANEYSRQHAMPLSALRSRMDQADSEATETVPFLQADAVGQTVGPSGTAEKG